MTRKILHALNEAVKITHINTWKKIFFKRESPKNWTLCCPNRVVCFTQEERSSWTCVMATSKKLTDPYRNHCLVLWTILLHITCPCTCKNWRKRRWKRVVQVCSCKATLGPHGCFAWTDWQVFTKDHSLKRSVTAVTSYIQYCESMLIPQTTVKCYPNNKPWLTAHLTRAIQAKCRACTTGHRTEGKASQIVLKREIAKATRTL